jgi:hypothetical protein
MNRLNGFVFPGKHEKPLETVQRKFDVLDHRAEAAVLMGIASRRS